MEVLKAVLIFWQIYLGICRNKFNLPKVYKIKVNNKVVTAYAEHAAMGQEMYT